jgi:hypothetical protein
VQRDLRTRSGSALSPSDIVGVADDDDEFTPTQRLTTLFARQDGLATFRQAERCGVSRGTLRRRLRDGEWVAIDRTVFAIAGMQRSWRRDVRAALLSVGSDAAISHATAARMHRLDGFDTEPEIHITVFGEEHHSAPSGAIVHRSRHLTAKQCPLIEGMRVVSKPIALVQVAATRGEDAARQALDSMLRGGTSTQWIRHVASEWRRRGVPGPRLVLDLLDTTESRLPRSWFQRLGRRAVAATGVSWVDEHPVHDPATGRHIADLDLAAPELMIGIECQSWRWHATPTARAADARRKRRLRKLGWDIIELWYADLDRPDEVLADIVDAVARSDAQRRSTAGSHIEPQDAEVPPTAP